MFESCLETAINSTSPEVLNYPGISILGAFCLSALHCLTGRVWIGLDCGFGRAATRGLRAKNQKEGERSTVRRKHRMVDRQIDRQVDRWVGDTIERLIACRSMIRLLYRHDARCIYWSTDLSVCISIHIDRSVACLVDWLTARLTEVLISRCVDRSVDRLNDG